MAANAFGPTETTTVYDTLTNKYNITTDNTSSPNRLWRCDYTGHNPQNRTDLGEVGVRSPSSPTNGFEHVFYEYPYKNINTGQKTSASLVTTESPYFTDVDFAFYVRTISQKKLNPNPWETWWVMFRYNEAGNDPNSAGSRYHHYYLAGKTNSMLELGKKDNTAQTDEQYFLSSGVPYSFHANQWNKVRIKVDGNNTSGNRIIVWIDDIKKIDVLDNGSGGIQSRAPNTPPAPSAYLNSGLIGFYNEDAEVEFGPLSILVS
jgi:Domain of Unknown Function (DUF1080)